MFQVGEDASYHNVSLLDLDDDDFFLKMICLAYQRVAVFRIYLFVSDLFEVCIDVFILR